MTFLWKYPDMVQWYKPPRNKTTNMAVRPAKTQFSLAIRPVWSVFAVRMKKVWALSYPLSAQRSLWSDWADAKAVLSLRWAHSHFVVVFFFFFFFFFCCHEAAHMPLAHIFNGTRRISIDIPQVFRITEEKEDISEQCEHHNLSAI